jgi:hypothetical protein
MGLETRIKPNRPAATFAVFLAGKLAQPRNEFLRRQGVVLPLLSIDG